MDQTVEIQPPVISFSKQAGADGKSCTAHAAINTLVLGGLQISDSERHELVSFTQNTKPLEISEREALFQKHNLNYHSLSMELVDIQRTPSALFDAISEVMDKQPVGFAISTYLSRRPEEFREGKNIYHAVTARKDGTKIRVIDSYDPDKPEVFNTEKETERLRFLAWFMSGRAQDLIFSGDQPKTKENILALAHEKIESDDPLVSKLFIGESLSTGIAYYGSKD